MMIRFTSNARDGISWFKGDVGEVVSILVKRPQATSDIYIARVRDRNVWCTTEDFDPWNQLSLW
jgi:hypothetical protein